MIFTDTHAHLYVEDFQSDLQEVLLRAREQGLGAIINMGDSMENSAKCIELMEAHDILYSGVGIHPEEAVAITEKELTQLATWAEMKKTLAIGEIGLDYYWEKDSDKRQLQRELFIKQLDLARQVGLPVCIHDREAHGDTLSILKKEGRGIPGVLHCFSGSLEMAKELISMGWYIGIDGPLTFKNAAKLPEIVKNIPLEHILIETDCPYMAPVPKRGKRNEPAYVYYVAEKLAQYRGESLERIAEVTTQNARELYKLPI